MHLAACFGTQDILADNVIENEMHGSHFALTLLDDINTEMCVI